MGLQLRTVDLQGLDALLLLQKLFLVEHLLGQVFVGLTHRAQRLLVGRQLRILSQLLRLQLCGLLSQTLAQRHQLSQAFQTIALIE